jgi:hypothetical protein
MTDGGQPQPDPERKPEEGYDPEMTEADEANTPPESGDDGEDNRPVERPL